MIVAKINLARYGIIESNEKVAECEVELESDVNVCVLPGSIE